MLKTWLAHHGQAARDSLNALFRKPLATGMTVLVIAITLVLPALFWVMTFQVRQVTAFWQDGSHISLYLNQGLSPKEATGVLLRVRAMPEVREARLIQPDEGLALLQAQEGMQDIKRYLPENPLPAVIDVLPALSLTTPTQLEVLLGQLNTVTHVDSAKLDMQWIERLHAILGFLTTLTRILMAGLVLAVLLIVGNLLRLAVRDRHDEIKILKLIGATDAFITRPLLYTGMWYGLIGALVAVVLMQGVLLGIGIAAGKLLALYQLEPIFLYFPSHQAALLVVLSALLGWLGAWLAVKKQLSLIEPYG